MIENGLVEAINFELHATDPSAGIRLIESVAKALGLGDSRSRG